MKGRDRMLQDIEAEVQMTRHYIGRTKLDVRVMAAMKNVPRAEFVPEGMKPFAYDNGPLAIGHGQTISQPYIVALMTDLLQPQPEHTILEIGTGSGYQAAVLSLLTKQVYSVEIIGSLADAARERLRRLGYTNVEVRHGDGNSGWPEHAPYDGIIVTAAAPAIPAALVEQLKAPARLVIPVGLPYMPQQLMVVEKDAQGGITTRDVLGVAFVPLTGEHRPAPASAQPRTH